MIKIVDNTKVNCGCYLLIMVFNLVVGGWSVAQILGWFGKDIPFFWDMVIGLFVGLLVFPVAVIGWILKLCGVF